MFREEHFVCLFVSLHCEISPGQLVARSQISPEENISSIGSFTNFIPSKSLSLTDQMFQTMGQITLLCLTLVMTMTAVVAGETECQPPSLDNGFVEQTELGVFIFKCKI